MSNKETFKLSDIERENLKADEEREQALNLNKLSFVSGWFGGHWEISGKKADFADKPELLVWVDGERYPACYQETPGHDYDHGNKHDWARIDIGILDGVVMPKFLSAKDLLEAGHTVFVTKKGTSILILRDPTANGKVIAVHEEPTL